MRLERDFFNRETITVSKELLGKFLVTDLEEGIVIGKIIETEAYMGVEDLACHASKGKTPRTKVLFQEVGRLYVYLNYGIFWLTNVVAHTPIGVGGILLRTAQIVEGKEIAAERIKKNKFVKVNDKIATGPGKLSVAFGIEGDFHNLDFIKSDKIYLEDRGEKIQPNNIISAKRIGVDYAQHCKDYPWRFYIKNNELISKK